jgi:hypothetical protein
MGKIAFFFLLINKKCQNHMQSNAISLKDCIFVVKMS